MLIDFHTHCFPDKIAEKAIHKLSYASGGMIPSTDGTKEGLLASMDAHGVDISVVLNIATNAHQQASVNDFAASIHSDRLVAFGSVFPDSPDALSELERIHDMGLVGVKLHPDYQGFSVDDPNMKPLYQKIASLGLVTVFHAGLDYGFPPPYGATPEKMARALPWFEGAPVVAAHFGGLGCCEEVLAHLCGKEIYFDTSFGCGQLPRYYAEKIIKTHGADKILFGTDSPWHIPMQETRLMDTLALTEEECKLIFSENAKRLLHLS